MDQEKQNRTEKVLKNLERIMKMRDDLAVKLDEIFKKANITPEILENFLNNPDNFTKEQWQNIQKQKELYKLKLSGLVSKKAIAKHKENLKKKAAGGERSRKTLGGRKKWIPMR